MRILVAEDNQMNQKLIQIMLQKGGYDYIVVADGIAAIAEAKKNKFGLILMDCQMPEMDGLEAARQIRKHEAESNSTRTPILALTANSMKGDREKCIDSGMDDFISKPVKMTDFLDRINKWFQK